MRLRLAVICSLALGLSGADFLHANECCGPGMPDCKPRWEDKKTKTPKYTMKCDDECVRGFDRWCDHGCCPEDTPPCGGVFTRKKLLKKEEDKVERVLKYDVATAPCTPCLPLPPAECRPAWYDLPGHCRRLFGCD